MRDGARADDDTGDVRLVVEKRVRQLRERLAELAGQARERFDHVDIFFERLSPVLTLVARRIFDRLALAIQAAQAAGIQRAPGQHAHAEFHAEAGALVLDVAVQHRVRTLLGDGWGGADSFRLERRLGQMPRVKIARAPVDADEGTVAQRQPSHTASWYVVFTAV